MNTTATARAYRHCPPAKLLLFRERTDVDVESGGESGSESRDESQRAPSTSSQPSTSSRPSTSSQPSTSSARSHWPEPESASASDWIGVHAQLVSLGTTRAAHEREVCRWLLAAQRLGVHARTGYASLAELADRLLGLNARQTEERLRVGRALGDLRVLDGALASGALSWCAVRELTRVATPETEQAWLDWARGRRQRQVEVGVASRKLGDLPRDRPDPSLVKHRLAFAVRAETMAMFRDLQSAVRADLGGRSDDDTILYEIARRALGGPGDDGRASYQVAVSRCDECGRSRIDAAGGSHPVDQAIVDMMACDSQHIDTGSRAVVHSPGESGSASTGPGGGSATEKGRGRRAGAATPAVPARIPHVGAARLPATQRVASTLRRAVMRRDHKRCVMPGCSSHRFLDVHHLDPRAEGGSNDPDRLAVLCGAHHTAVHRGVICVDGTASGGFVFRHGDGTPYGGDVDVPRLDTARQAVAALQQMGFRATQARVLVDAALRSGAPGDPAGLLHAALRGS